MIMMASKLIYPLLVDLHFGGHVSHDGVASACGSRPLGSCSKAEPPPAAGAGARAGRLHIVAADRRLRPDGPEGARFRQIMRSDRAGGSERCAPCSHAFTALDPTREV